MLKVARQWPRKPKKELQPWVFFQAIVEKLLVPRVTQ